MDLLDLRVRRRTAIPDVDRCESANGVLKAGPPSSVGLVDLVLVLVPAPSPEGTCDGIPRGVQILAEPDTPV
jgi:hypothetical protein